ncbi:hypothetical protein PFISCL1PPCAC_5821, partial [Pristionchus fissidentatus]
MTMRTRKDAACRLCQLPGHYADECSKYTGARDRMTIVLQRKLCRNCLQEGHMASSCPSRKVCFKCKGPHYTAICGAETRTTVIPPQTATPNVKANTPAKVKHGTNANTKRTTTNIVFDDGLDCPEDLLDRDCTFQVTESSLEPLLKEIPAFLLCITVYVSHPEHPDKEIPITAMFDCGSNVSYLLDSVADDLQLFRTSAGVSTVHTYGKKEGVLRESDYCRIALKQADGSRRLLRTKSSKYICTNVPWMEFGEEKELVRRDSSPQILLGMDVLPALFLYPGFSIRLLEDGHQVMESRLGPIICQSATPEIAMTEIINAAVEELPAHNSPQDISDVLTKFWDLDTIGITDSPKDDDESRCLQLFKESIRYDSVEHRFYCALPFKVEPSDLPSNFGLAFRRLQSNIKNLVNSQRPTTNADEAKRAFHDLRKLFGIASMNLREWTSNCPEFNRFVEELKLGVDDFKNAKVLGMHWNTVEDVFSIPPIKVPNVPHWTRRAILKFIASIFDPMGIVSPASLPFKIFLQMELASHPLWWTGPPFWKESEEKWPEKMILPATSTEISNAIMEENEIVASPVDSTRFSRWIRLLRTMMFVLIFITRFSKDLKKKFGSTRTSLLIWSEIILFRQAQRDFPPTSTIERQLRLFICPKTGLWRCRGRISTADLPEDTKFPIYLPRESRITRLFILYVHESLNHAGYGHTLIGCRERVWIPKGRAAVRSTLEECRLCKRKKAKPFALPEFPSLPSVRTTVPDYPFQHIGMDFAGPWKCKVSEGVVKVWILLITCLNTRAVYLDAVPDQSTRTLLSRIRRFIASQGTADVVTATWKATLHRLNSFWARWKKEYLVNLREVYTREHPHPRSTSTRFPEKGEIVIIDDELDSGQWKLAEVIDSRDDYNRSATVRLASGSTLTRPISKLYAMELRGIVRQEQQMDVSKRDPPLEADENTEDMDTS